MITGKHKSSHPSDSTFRPVTSLDLGEMLAQSQVITREQLDVARKKVALSGEPLDRVLINNGFATEEDVLRHLSAHLGLPFVRLNEVTIDPAIVSQVPAKLVLAYRFMPLEMQNGACSVAISNPMNLNELDTLKLSLNCQIKPVLATSVDIAEMTKKYYGLGAETIQQMADEIQGAVATVGGVSEEDIDRAGQDPSVVKFVNQLLIEALNADATDIHIEPFETRLRVRFRVDGIMQEQTTPPGLNRFKSAIASRVKIMASLNIAERRMPQDGRIRVKMAGEEFDLRVSVLPTRWGESVNMRILNRKNIFYDLDHLGLAERQRKLIERLIDLPHGIVLVTGPTGSGKTTTLYATLQKINVGDLKIITIEDPIEYQLEGVIQVQIHEKIKLTFARALRSFLRHDPDIILVGEIRDPETAQIAIQAALTGHLVFSTVHTNDAPGAITRLIDMGVEPFLVASSFEGIIAQRLVRRLCPHCKEEDQPSPIILEEVQHLFPDRKEPFVFWKGKGCAACKSTGYKGRIAIFEIMMMTEEIRSLVVKNSPTNVLRAKAMEEGLTPLRSDGWTKALDGVTSIREILSIARLGDLSYK